MIILDIKNNTQYDLSSVSGTLLNVEFGNTEMTSYSEWDAMATSPLHKGNYQTWEEAEIKILIKGSNRTTLEKRISYLKSLLNYADVYFTEMGFDFHFRGELNNIGITYFKEKALVTATMKGRKISTAQEIVFNTSATVQTGSARVNWMGNCKVPLRIDMDVPVNTYTPAAIQLTCRNGSGTTLWTERIDLKQWRATGSAFTVTIDGARGVMYATNTTTSARENWVENYKAKFLPYVESTGDVLTMTLLGALGGQSIGVTKVKLTFEGRWA